jgi:hypothetical protein
MKASGDGNLLFNPFTRNSGQQLTVYTPLTLTGMFLNILKLKWIFMVIYNGVEIEYIKQAFIKLC